MIFKKDYSAALQHAVGVFQKRIDRLVEIPSDKIIGGGAISPFHQVELFVFQLEGKRDIVHPDGFSGAV